jgi:ParB-like chromosome segregation protein Spo0J
MSATQIAIESLVFDPSIFPRQNLDEQHVRGMVRAMEGGIVLPPIIVDKKTRRIVDGVHRYHAALQRGAKKIAGVLKNYPDEAAIFKDAVTLNSGVGLKLGQDDTLKVIEIGERLGFKEIDLAGMLRTSIAHLRLIKPRYATVEEAEKGVSKLRRVALKGSVRHMAGQKISKGQAEAMTSAPGQSYLLNVQQILDAIEWNLLPPRKQHPVLWERLEELAALIAERVKKSAA